MLRHPLAIALVVTLQTVARAESPDDGLELSVTVRPGASQWSRVVLKRVSAASTFADAGLRAGDVIQKIDDAVPTLEVLSLLALPHSVYTKQHTIEYSRDGAVSTVVGQGGTRPPLTSSRLVPAFQSGQFIGFKVVQLLADSTPARAGLRNGDVVVAINGQRLKTPEVALEALTKSAGMAQVEVERRPGEQKVTLQFPAEALLAPE